MFLCYWDAFPQYYPALLSRLATVDRYRASMLKTGTESDRPLAWWRPINRTLAKVTSVQSLAHSGASLVSVFET